MPIRHCNPLIKIAHIQKFEMRPVSVAFPPSRNVRRSKGLALELHIYGSTQ
jgi:hypothetical protein